MNVFDFDKTLYDGDSTFDFWMFSIRKYPYLICYIPVQVYYAVLFKLDYISRDMFKEKFYIFLCGIKDIDGLIDLFWEKHSDRFLEWYCDWHKDTDVVISASPEFLVVKGCKYIGISNVIASKVNKNTGKCEGNNCRAEQKVDRFFQEYKNEKIDCFFSDSKSDEPLANVANKAFLIKNNKPSDWK